MLKRVVSIITWPLRFLRKLFGLLLRALGKLVPKRGRQGANRGKAGGKSTGAGGRKSGARGKLAAPFRKLARLRGKARIAAIAVLGLVVIVAVLALRPGPDADKDVRATLDRFERASRDKDYQTLCDELLATELVDRIRSAGLPCEVALRTGLEDRRNPMLKVLAVEVNGDQALAKLSGGAVGEVPATSTYRLVRENDQWRIATPPGGSGAGSPAEGP